MAIDCIFTRPGADARRRAGPGLALEQLKAAAPGLGAPGEPAGQFRQPVRLDLVEDLTAGPAPLCQPAFLLNGQVLSHRLPGHGASAARSPRRVRRGGRRT